MKIEEEKIIKCLKLTFLFLFTMLILLLLGEPFALTLLVFYMAFIKDYRK